MVSKASEDFPEPERPVNTISLSRGRSSVTFLRLCSRAPWMTRRSEPTDRVYRRPATGRFVGRRRRWTAYPSGHGAGPARNAAVPGGRGALPEDPRARLRASHGAVGPAAVARR